MKTNELKCTDLRIGNYLKYNNKIVRVFELHPRYIGFDNEENFVVGDNPEYFDPIELTEEVLLKIGFKKDPIITQYNKEIDDFLISYIDGVNGCLLSIQGKKSQFYKYDIKYLHELQNAYFLLTNQEMEIEL